MEHTKEQLERYFKEYYNLIYRVAFAQLRNGADAEDITQEIFVKILTNTDAFDTKEHEKAWILRVTVNLCKDYRKSSYYQTRVGLDSLPELGQYPMTDWDETQQELLPEVLSLPEAYKNCLYLFYYEGYSIKEIAGILNMRENTVKTNLRRGREMLKGCLKA